MLAFLFHLRREVGHWTPGVEPVSVNVEPAIAIGGRLYRAQRESPRLLFFHGNGEIAADYDDLAPRYTEMGITLLVMDYRGYGTSDGTPTATKLSKMQSPSTMRSTTFVARTTTANRII